MMLGRPDAALSCPRDQATMLKLDVDDGAVVLDRCPTCKGTWFDTAELRLVTKDAQLERLAEQVRAFREPSPFSCPRCGGACIESFVGDVQVDTCTLCHGIWLDHGELEEAKRQLDAKRALDGAGLRFRSFLSRL
jgi:Zn-finger nucleic acid-binding protein